ncbi:riboflavin synthase [Oceanotoga sp. DSM 15011]|jgi:riboflavin synthase|uniref:Riboflavin synthase n=1 Tax=Oceanotoga teriensis TaxID=515440 RepID=A0AA45HJV0_9BACT|nr:MULTISPECIES: riboflavin synthase [Oceanotoga]MDN5342718.1 riboflavin synthase [Oceanotoga sp.]MDO7977603.1 riboflavin synthase [Oceanotoga teriensis]PWJ96452.1 riboflavin synthase alpha chain [Oceanotoga teriensis]UYP00374.1 riboflavin synthase [Oceanotoga sp. DSM 15011]
MFTGIIEKKSDFNIFNNKIVINNFSKEIKLGDSIALNGVCLTVDSLSESKLQFTLGEETKKITNINISKKLNIERALKFNGRLDGHIVTGHIDGMIRFLNCKKISDTYYMEFKMPKENWAIVRKGAIALNGISLTIAEKYMDSFVIQVIPHTYLNTNLFDLKMYDYVNYEIDILNRYARGEKYGY